MIEEFNYLFLKEFATLNGACCFGVANIEEIKYNFLLKKEITELFHAGISVGIRLSRTILADIENHPTRLYYHHYKVVNYMIDQLTLRMANLIQSKGYEALQIPASQTVDWENQKAHFSHKKVAELAGIGWLGRHNLIVHPQYGAQLRLGTVLTNMPIKKDKPLNKDCGKCKKCIPVCPAKAINESPKDFDHLACYEMLKEFRRKHYVPQYICGICVKTCDGLPK